MITGQCQVSLKWPFNDYIYKNKKTPEMTMFFKNQSKNSSHYYCVNVIGSEAPGVRIAFFLYYLPSSSSLVFF